MFDDAAPPSISPAPLAEENSLSTAAARTTCPYCGVGCGVLAKPDGAGGANISGDPAHPANFGRLCSKGSALGETLGLGGRVLYPMRRRDDGAFERVSWDAALDEAAEKFRRVVARHGPNAVALYLSGQLLTEDYYVGNKLMKGYIGSANVDTNSRLCMASTVAGHRRAFGADAVPSCYEDIDQADLIVLVGSNAAWCHPILYQRIMRNKAERGARLVVVDTRRTATTDSADLFLQLAPGTDQALFCGLLVHLAKVGALDEDYIARCTSGFDAALQSARDLAPDAAATAMATGLREADVAAYFELFAAAPRAVTAFSQGVNQSAQGTDKVNAIINCHLATGRIGKPGASPFSLTGQPNAMGGREVGGLANQLAAHMGFDPESVDRVRRFWGAPRMAEREGLKAVQMFEAVERGEIKALWVIGTNPAASLPAADRARDALRKLDFLIVSDNVLSNDTINAGADLLLPAQAWGEKDGTVTNSERRISRQRPFLRAPGEARPDWEALCGFARRMGFAGFDFATAAAVFREHAALSAFENGGARDFDLGGLAALSDEEYDALEPTQWPVRSGETHGRKRLFAEGGFFTPDGRAIFVAPAPPALGTRLSSKYPLRLNTGRIRDQWHTMTRTGQSRTLARHIAEPFVEINPDDAARLGVADGGFAKVATQWGECALRAVVTDRQAPGRIFAPIHWTSETASHGRVAALPAPIVDPLSGQPETKATPASLTALAYSSQGFLLARKALAPPQGAWWARAAIPDGVGYRVATNAPLPLWREFFRAAASSGDIVEYLDEARGVYRAASFIGDRAGLVLFMGSTAASWDAVLPFFASANLDAAQRRALLSGRSDGVADEGPLVCACFGVGAKRIEAAIAEGCRTAADIGAKLRAGANCGSCLPEIGRMIESARSA